MTTISSSDSVDAQPRESANESLLSSTLREPLLHFVLLGACLFGIDHVLSSRVDDPHTIVLTAQADRDARQLFRDARGHDPDATELAALRQLWLDNEVLYREGLALQVDKGDTAIRERVIFKALSVVDANVQPPAADEKTLRDWFESHRAKYDEPARFDFDEAIVSGDRSESSVRAFVETLEHGVPGDIEAGLRVFKGRPLSNVKDAYGDAFAEALAAAPLAQWRAFSTKDGWRAMRLNASLPAKPAAYDVMRNVVLADWTDETMARQRTDAVRALAKKYTLKVEAPAP